MLRKSGWYQAFRYECEDHGKNPITKRISTIITVKNQAGDILWTSSLCTSRNDAYCQAVTIIRDLVRQGISPGPWTQD